MNKANALNVQPMIIKPVMKMMFTGLIHAITKKIKQKIVIMTLELFVEKLIMILLVKT